jgi:hypothetical protein
MQNAKMSHFGISEKSREIIDGTEYEQMFILQSYEWWS